MNDYAYTDRQVREDEHLQAEARAYLRGYGGDFEFLVAAKMRLEAENYLPIAVMRGVLNCMRADPRAPKRLIAQPELRVISAQRPAWIRLNTTWKKEYLYSTWANAYLAHILDKDRTELRWYPHVERYDWIPYVYCGLGFGDKKLLRMTDQVPVDYVECDRCGYKRDEMIIR